jgi:hypothetical protein
MYPGLSHLFMPIEGGQKATPATYTVAGHVAEEVVNEIGSWIKRRARLPPTKAKQQGEKFIAICFYPFAQDTCTHTYRRRK